MTIIWADAGARSPRMFRVPRPSPFTGSPQATRQSLPARWRVQEVAVFGSALHQDFRRDSAVDLLVTDRNGKGTQAAG